MKDIEFERDLENFGLDSYVKLVIVRSNPTSYLMSEFSLVKSDRITMTSVECGPSVYDSSAAIDCARHRTKYGSLNFSC